MGVKMYYIVGRFETGTLLLLAEEFGARDNQGGFSFHDAKVF